MRILVADDQSKVRFALRVLLERQPGWTVVGEAVDFEGMATQVETRLPDMVLVGWELPGLATTNSLSALRKCRSDLRIIALSGRSESQRAALSAGADAFVSKGDPPERLLDAIANCNASNSASKSE